MSETEILDVEEHVLIVFFHFHHFLNPLNLILQLFYDLFFVISLLVLQFTEIQLKHVDDLFQTANATFRLGHWVYRVVVLIVIKNNLRLRDRRFVVRTAVLKALYNSAQRQNHVT